MNSIMSAMLHTSDWSSNSASEREGGPDTSGQGRRGGQASDVSRRGVLLSRASADASSGDAWAGEAPVIRGRRRANETAEGVPNVSVGLGQGVGLKRGRDGSARIQDLSPSYARAEESEGPVSILVLADCMKKATPWQLSWTADVHTTCDLRWRPQVA